MTVESLGQELRQYFVGARQVPGIHEILRDNKLIGEFKGNGLGQSVHAACEYLDKPEGLDWASVPDEAYPYVMAYQKMKSEKEFIPRRIEEKIVNPILSYGGRLDREGTWNVGDNAVLLEIKTVPAVWWHGIQLALQDMLLPALTKPRDRYVVELKKNGDYALTPFYDHNDFAIAQACIALFWLRRNHNCK